MRNVWRMLAFDIAAPLVAIAALLIIGWILEWPLWWVSACSVVCLLIVQAMIVNFVLMRRDSVTVGTDDDRPGLRLAAVCLTAAALVAAVIIGYVRWTIPDHGLRADSAEVLRLATSVAEATATFSPQDPTASIDRAVAMMPPEQGDAFRKQFAESTADLARRDVSAQAMTVSAGVEALGPAAASVAVVLRVTQNSPGEPPSRAVAALRVQLAKQDGGWLVFDVAPIHSR